MKRYNIVLYLRTVQHTRSHPGPYVKTHSHFYPLFSSCDIRCSPSPQEPYSTVHIFPVLVSDPEAFKIRRYRVGALQTALYARDGDVHHSSCLHVFFVLRFLKACLERPLFVTQSYLNLWYQKKQRDRLPLWTALHPGSTSGSRIGKSHVHIAP